jgi:hypothetical protein
VGNHPAVLRGAVENACLRARLLNTHGVCKSLQASASPIEKRPQLSKLPDTISLQLAHRESDLRHQPQ